MIGGDEELNDYVVKAKGIGRTELNVMCVTGLFVFGWLQAVAFSGLGKGSAGCLLIVAIMVLLVVASLFGLAEFWFIALLIYIVGWIAANRILSRYESVAKRRITEIDQMPSSDQTTDVLLERGLLASKVLRQRKEGSVDFDKVIHLPGGDPQLLNLAGVELIAARQFAEAKRLLDRARETAQEEALIRQIERNQVFVQRRLR